MTTPKNLHFASLFKKYRLQSGFSTLKELADYLSQEGLIYDDSLLSRWQNGTRVPKDRKVVLKLIEVFVKKGGIKKIKEADKLLSVLEFLPLTTEEKRLFFSKKPPIKKIPPVKKLIKFFITTAASKRLLRTGWVREKIKDPESVAEHSFALSLMALILADYFGLDKEKLIKMAILHDLGELVTGDIVWARGRVVDLDKLESKIKKELKGIEKIFNIIGKGDEYKKLFLELTERKTPEAIFFWELDKLEVCLQALIYEKEQGKKLEEFFIHPKLQIKTPFFKEIIKEIEKQRPKFKPG
jgi:putative hydrolase of HD superfamily